MTNTTPGDLSDAELPPLPEPAFHGMRRGGLLRADGWTEEQVREAQRAAIKADRERREDEANCAEEWLDHYAAQLDLKETAFDCLGDYVKAVVNAALSSRATGAVPADAITVNLVRLAGLDKHKARECEAIVRQVLDSAPEAPAAAVTTGMSLVPTEILNRFPELNPSNYDHDDACAVNAWGVEVVLAAVDATPPAAAQAEPREPATRALHETADAALKALKNDCDWCVRSEAASQLRAAMAAQQSNG